MEFLRGEWDIRDMGGSKEPQMEANILGGLNSFDIGGLMVLFVRGTHGLYCRLNILLWCWVCAILGVFCTEGPLMLRIDFWLKSRSTGVVSWDQLAVKACPLVPSRRSYISSRLS